MNAYKYRIRLLEPVNVANNEKVLESIRAIAKMISNNPEEHYIKNLRTPVLKSISGVAQNIKMCRVIFLYGNGLLATKLNNPDFVIDVLINNKWEEITKANFKRISDLIIKK